MPKQKRSGHSPDFVLASIEKRNESISPLFAKSSEAIECIDVFFCKLVPALPVAGPYRVGLSYDILGELLHELLNLIHRQVPLETFWIAR